MSASIDEKVVEMRFDNKDFEKNVSTTMTTLEKLKASLKFDGIADSFGKVKDAFAGFDANPVSDEIENAGGRFSAFQTIATGALLEIGKQVVELGEKIAKNLVFDQFSAGWQKFADKTQAVGTLMSQGFSMDEVNEQLEKLMFYTDETSYNFVDMVSTIGKFTASGQTLQDSTTALMGIANWAALSGQNASVASRAMYQLAQAMSIGALKYQDYKSIQNANMDTMEFRQQAAKAAIELGQLRKEADGTYTILEELDNGVVNVAADGLTLNDLFTSDILTRQAWLDSETMIKVFSNYASAVDSIKAYVDANDVTASEAIEALSSQLDPFAVKAFKAAQEARTFADSINSIKDAASSGFTAIFESLFGDYEEATKLWTDLANRGYDAFVEPINSLGDLLQGGLQSGWKSFSDEISLSSGMMDRFKEILISVAESKGLDVSGLVEGGNAFVEALHDGVISSDVLDEAIETLRHEYAGMTEEELSAIGMTKNLRSGFASFVAGVRSGIISVDDLADSITELSGRENLIQSFWNVWDAIADVIGTVKEAFREIFPPVTSEQIYEITQKILEFTEKLALSEEASEKLHVILKGIFSIFSFIKRVISAVVKGFSPVIDVFKSLIGIGGDALASIGELFIKINESEKTAAVLEKVSTTISSILEFIIKSIEKVIDFIKRFLNIEDDASKENGFTNKLKTISGALSDVFSSIESHSGILSAVVDLFKKLFESVAGLAGLSLNGLFAFGKAINFDNIIQLLSGLTTGVFSGVIALASDVASFIKNVLLVIKESVPELIQIVIDIFNSILQCIKNNIGEIITNVIEIIENVIKALTDKAPDLISVITDLFVSILTSVRTNLPIIIDEIVSTLKDILAILGEKVPEIMSDVIHFAVTILNSLAKAIEDEEGNLTSAAKTLITGVLALLIKEMLSGVASFGDIIDGISGVLGALQNKINAKALKDIGIAIALIVGSLFVLSKMDPKKLGEAIKTLTVAIGELIGSAVLLAKTTNGAGKDLKKTTSALLVFAIAIFVLVFALKSIADIDSNQLATAKNVLLTLIASLVGSAITISKASTDLSKSAFGIIAFAAGVWILTKAVETLSKIDDNGLNNAVLAIGEIIGITLIALKLLSEIDGLTKSAVALILVGVALNIFASAIKSLSSMTLEQIGLSLLALGIALAEVIASLWLLSKIDGLTESAVALILVGVALNIFASAIKSLSSMTLEQIGLSLLALGGALTEVVLALNFIPDNAVSKAASLILVGIALNVFAVALKTLSTLSLEQVGIALLAIAGTLIVLGAAAYLLGPVIPIILKLSVAIAVFGVAMLAAGAGAFLLATALSIMLAAGVSIVDVIVDLVYRLILLVPFAVESITVAVELFLKWIIDSGPLFISALKSLLEVFIVVFTESIPTLVSTILLAVHEILSAIEENLPSIIQSGMNIVLALLSGIEQNIGEIVIKFIDIVINIIDAISEKLPDLIDSGINLVISFISGVAQGIEDNKEEMKQAVLDLLGSIIDLILEFFGISEINGERPSKELAKIGKSLINGLISGIVDIAEKAWTSIKEFFQGIIDNILDFLGIKDTDGNEDNSFWQIAGDWIAGLVQGFKDKISDTWGKVKDWWNTIVGNIKAFLGIGDGQSEESNSFFDIAKNLIDGFINGIKKMAEDAWKSVSDFAKGVLDKITGVFDEHSPSKETEKMGKYLDEGLAIGITSGAKSVAKKAEKMAKSVLQGFEDGMENDGYDFEPTIRPILDLDNVSNSAAALNSLFNDQSSIDIAASTRISVDDQLDRLQNGISVNNDDVIREMGSLHAEVSTLKDTIRDLQIVLDSGELVGAMAGPMDSALGRRYSNRIRGM